MTNLSADPPVTSLDPSKYDDDPRLTFQTDVWIEPPTFEAIPPETLENRIQRLHQETDYRNHTNPTAWHRFLTLGRYVVDGSTFDDIMNDIADDPLRAHCTIWYQYMYHIDRNIDIPQKLEYWATYLSQPYLSIHAPSVLMLDTTKDTWSKLVAVHAISVPWTKVGPSKARTKQSISPASSISRFRPPSVPTIHEEPMTPVAPIPYVTPRPPPTNPTQKDSNSAASSSDGKASAFISDLGVPLNDGTHRITIRWKTSLNLRNISSQTGKMNESIQALLTDLFTDEDGYIYKWNNEGLDKCNLISAMSSAEVRSFLAPTITIIPSQSLIVIPLRFGFTGNSPSDWRNRDNTRSILEKQQATVSISNSKTTSGKLVIAGYILLKAPRTTHRIRYSQSLRRLLPAHTPPFDILLHSRTPMDQNIDHLAVQCGESHVHSLSQALLTILTGYRSAIYIPRFAFVDMSKEKICNLFATHEKYITSLSFLCLTPFINNIDVVRTETFPDGNTLERSTREWATSIMADEEGETAQCDIVNGGYDNKTYILFPPQFEAIVNRAFNEYRDRIYPFKQREAKFRETIGPPTVIVFHQKVQANLQWMEKILSKEPSHAPSPNQEGETSRHNTSNQNNNSMSSSVSDSSASTSTPEQFGRPPTPLESLRNRYRNLDSSTDGSDDQTNATTTSSTTGGGMSTTNAKFREMEAILKRQQKMSEKRDQHTSDRLQQVERHLHRLELLETNIACIKTDVTSQLDCVRKESRDQFKSLEEQLLTSMRTQIASGTNVQKLDSKIEVLIKVVEKLASEKEELSSSSSEKITSPKKKKLRSRVTDDMDADLEITTPRVLNSLSLLTNDESPKVTNTHISEDITMLEEVKTDLEGRYNEPHSPGRGNSS